LNRRVAGPAFVCLLVTSFIISQDSGQSQRAFLGVILGDELGVTDEGIYITGVMPDSAALEAGIMKGDIVTHVNDGRVTTITGLQSAISRFGPGDTISLEIIRSGKTLKKRVTLKSKPKQQTYLFPSFLYPFEKNGKYGFRDAHLNTVIEPKYDAIGGESGGLWAFRLGNRWGFLDSSSGKIMVKAKWEKALRHREGLAAVRKKNKWGYINAVGKVLIKPKYEAARDFSENMAAVKLNNKFGYINKENTFVISPAYEAAGTFLGGMAPAKIRNKWGFINTDGAFVIEPLYESARRSTGNLSTVKVSNRWGVIDNKGNWVVRPYWHSAVKYIGLTMTTRGLETGRYGTKTNRLSYQWRFDEDDNIAVKISYNEDGSIYSKMIFTNSSSSGVERVYGWEEYSNTNRIEKMIVYKSNSKTEYTYYHNGVVKNERNYRRFDNQFFYRLHGSFKTYDKSGILKRERYYDHRKKGDQK